MIRICFPLVRYTLKMPVPPADMPRLKNLACTVKRGESGRTRTANGSSNDSSISCSVKELSRLKGGLFQSNSILSAGMYFQRPCNVFTLYLHGSTGIVNRLFHYFCKMGGPKRETPNPKHQIPNSKTSQVPNPKSLRVHQQPRIHAEP